MTATEVESVLTQTSHAMEQANRRPDAAQLREAAAYRVWMQGAAPLLSTEHLEALRDAIRLDSPNLIQGGTIDPPPLSCVRDWPCERACLLAYRWIGKTVADAEEEFAKLCFGIDAAMSEMSASRWLLDFFDTLPRERMREVFGRWVGEELARRAE